jgi:hypothetical protein
VNQPRKYPVVEQAEVVLSTEGSNEVIAKRRDGGYSTGVAGHGMLLKGLSRNLGGPMFSFRLQEVSSGCIG